MAAVDRLTLRGARQGPPNRLRRLVGRSVAQHLVAFVVPGPELLAAHGLDLTAGGLTIAASPRHANLLLLVGSIPAELARAVAVVHAQMPRPRAVLALASDAVAPLPPPDIALDQIDQEALLRGIAQLRGLFARGVWAPTTSPAPDAASAAHAPTAAAAHPPGAASGSAAHGPGPTQVATMHERVGQAVAEPRQHAAMAHAPTEHDMPMPMGEDGMSGHDMGGHDMGGGFMSMAAMTAHLPASPDGLRMEWVEARFGPLFPGLPGGLALRLTLDGDSVAGAAVERGVVARGLPATWLGPSGDFADRFAGLDPFAPAAYRFLARRALARAAGRGDSADASPWLAELERERAASHLVWLSRFAF
jgi:hypothetical protein